jgi:hypothetical protein
VDRNSLFPEQIWKSAAERLKELESAEAGLAVS